MRSGKSIVDTCTIDGDWITGLIKVQIDKLVRVSHGQGSSGSLRGIEAEIKREVLAI